MLGWSSFPVALSQTGDSPINMSGTMNVLVATNIPTNNYSTTTATNLLCSVPLYSNFGYISYFTNLIDQRIYVSESFLNEISFWLIDENGNPFALPNTARWRITLKLTPVWDTVTNI